ncbi:sensor histidine kinase [Aerococcaceae bacterium NML171108]|nr:sensor histidine kinase [Aerococcaceae bacterium NML171108]
MKTFRRLQIIIFAVLVVISSSVLLLGLAINYSFQQEQLMEQITTLTEQNVARSAEALETMLTTLEGTTKSIINQLRPNISDEKLSEVLKDSVALHDNIFSIAIADASGKIIQHAPDRFYLKHDARMQAQTWYQADRQYDTSLYSAPHVQNLFIRQYPWVISNTVPFMRGNTPHLLIIDYKNEMLELFFAEGEIGKRGYTFILDKHNQIIYHPQKQLLASGLKHEDVSNLRDESKQTLYDTSQQTIIATRRVGLTQWRIAGKTYIQDILSEAQEQLVRTSILIFGVVFGVIALIAYVAANYIAQPIQALSKQMRDWHQEASFEAIREEAPYEEASQLNRSYNQLRQEVHHLMATIKQEEAALRKSERNALEAQIQPHFLYNTLESILWMIERGKTKEASLMVRSLGKLLRISLSKGKEFITLEQEFEQVRSYLAIQGIRYKNQFDYHVELPEHLKNYETIKLIIQPLVENAIYHGISRTVDPGEIHIVARQEATSIVIEVSDNGQGMSEERSAAVRQHLVQKDEELGIGMRNVHERLQIYFGEQYGLTIESELDEGTTVSLRLPIVATEGGNANV